MSLEPAAPATWEASAGPRGDVQAPWTIDLALAAAEVLEAEGRRLVAQAEAIRARIRTRAGR